MSSKNFSGINSDSQLSSSAMVLESNETRKAQDIANYGLVTVKKDTSVYAAAGILIKNNISGLPVVDDTGLVGIISEKDVLRLLRDTEFLTSSVEDYMTRDVVCFDEEDSIVDICNCLMNNSFRRVPITYEGKLTGIISRADLIKSCIHKFKPKEQVGESAKGKERFQAKDVMQCGLLTVKRETPIYEAMEIIATRNITGLPVVDDGMNLVGIVSEKDVLRLLCDPNAKLGNAEDFMTEEVVSFNHEDSVFDICDCLVNNNFRRVPILNQGRIVGIISRVDLILYILKNKLAFFKHGCGNQK